MEIIKRDGRTVPFDKHKIIRVVNNAMRETIKGINEEVSNYVAEQVEEILDGHVNVTVEDVQDLIETLLMETPRKDVAKRYILYRASRNQSRGKRNQNKFTLLTNEFISQYKHKEPPMDQLGNFIFYRTYSRFLPEENRREYWWETVRRAVEYNCNLVYTTKEEAQILYDNIFHLKQFLSGRSFWTGGTEVSKLYPLSNFNCAFTVVDNIKAISDLFYLLMLGAGVGIRVLPEDIKKLPKFKTTLKIIHQDYLPVPITKRLDQTSLHFLSNDTAEIIIGDSKQGWCTSLYYYLTLCTDKMYRNIDKVIINYNNVRPYGEKLKTFGGFASGHTAVKNILDKTSKIISKNNDIEYLSLKPIDITDICNCVASGVVVGGVRRSAQASLISMNDTESIQAKNDLFIQEDGKWIENHDLSHRKMSNNSIFYTEKPSRKQLHWHMEQLKNSGEPGFINVEAAKIKYENFEGLNPCFEVLLPSKGVCNLVTLNVYSFIENNELNIDKLMQSQRLNIRAAYRMSTVELELIDWNNINKEDKIIGASLTGWQDLVSELNLTRQEQEKILLQLWETGFAACEEISKALNDKHPVSFAVIKPEGTLSLLPGVSPGVHYAHAPYYIRRVRISANDPLVKVCEELEFPVYNEVGETDENCKTKVIEFPCKSAAKATKHDISAIQQLENYNLFMDYYVDSNASVTITVKDHEWEEVEDWVWRNWDRIVAISFLSLSDSFYELMPYEQITKEEYEERKRSMRPFIPSLLSKYEVEETELDIGSMSDCEGGVCAIR